MEGIGNDYVYIDATENNLHLTPEQIKFLSNRNFGVGGDGVIFIRKSIKADFRMDMFNADGSSSEMCGNGIRCVGKFIYDRRLTSKKNPKIETGNGVLGLDLDVDGSGKVNYVSVDMGEPILVPSKIPVNWPNENPIINGEIEINGEKLYFTSVSMGNPHAVFFTENAEEIALSDIGPKIEQHAIFPKRVNAEFVSVKGRDHLYQRTWERGSGETLACGTGACAVAVAANLTGRAGKKVQIDLRGGTLFVDWLEKGNVILRGPAKEVFSGEIEI